jgi:hypothetical protein
MEERPEAAAASKPRGNAEIERIFITGSLLHGEPVSAE